jgi:hypothetical protein
MSNFVGDSQKVKNLYCENLYLSPNNASSVNYPGYIRYNKDTNNFEGLLGTDSDQYLRDTDNGWIDFGVKRAEKYIDIQDNSGVQEIITNPHAKLGGIKIGHNLHLDSQGVLSSFKKGISRKEHNVLTVSNKDTPTISSTSDPNLIDNEYQSSDFPTIQSAINFIHTDRNGSVGTVDNSFVIIVGPGVYNENLNIQDDFITIIGEDPMNTKISDVDTINSDTDSNIIKVIDINANNINLINLSVEVNYNINPETHYIYGIFSNGDNLLFNNLNITINTTVVVSNTDINIFGLYNSQSTNFELINSNITLENTDYSGTSNQLKKYCVLINNSQNYIDYIVKFNNNNLKILDNEEGISGNAYGIQAINSYLMLDNTKIELYGSNKNPGSSDNTTIGINNFQSKLEINNTDIFVKGDLSYGIYYLDSFEQNNVTPKILVNILNEQNYNINFDNTNKTIHLEPNFNTNNNNVNLEYFKNNDIISFKESSTSLNSVFYKIRNVYKSDINLNFNDTIKLYSNNFLVTETKNSGLLEKWYLTKLNNCNINSDTKDFILNNYYYVDNINSYFNSSSIIINAGGYYNSVYGNVLTVGKEKSDFSSLYDAINSIIDNSENNRYLINVNSGVYYEDNIIEMKPYVDVTGYNPGNTQIILSYNDFDTENTSIFSRNTSLFSNSFYVKLSYNSTIKNITFNKLYEQSNINFTTILFYDESSISSNNNYIYPYLENVVIKNDSNAKTNVGIVLNDFKSLFMNPFQNIQIIINNGTEQNIGIIAKNDPTIITNNPLNNSNFNKNENLIKNSEIKINSSSIADTSQLTYYQNTSSVGILLDSFSCIIDNVNINIKLNETGILRNNYISIYNISSNLLIKKSHLNNNFGYHIIRNNSVNDTNVYTTNIVDTLLNITDESYDYIIDDVIKCQNCITNNLKKFIENGKLLINNNLIEGDNTLLLGDMNYIRKNTILGSNTSQNLLGDSNNGYSDENIFLGYNSGANIRYASNNTFLGTNSGVGISDNDLVNSNTFVGSRSGYSNTGSLNIFMGFNSGLNNTGDENICIGNESGMSLTNSKNIFIGNSSGKLTTTGTRNTFIGHGNSDLAAGYNNIDGNDNIYIGYNCSNNNVGHNNLVMGNNSGFYLNGDNNVILGYEAGKGPTSINNEINNSIIIGYKSGYNSIKFDTNNYIGYQSGFSNETGKNNLFFGYNSGYNSLNKDNNIFIGYYSGFSFVTGKENLVLSNWNQNSNSEGNFNTFMGIFSGKNSIGDKNIILGYDSNIDGNRNIVLGNNVNTTSNLFTDNIFLGNDIGEFIITNNNIKLGNETTELDVDNINSGNNVLIGNYSSKLLVNGKNNIAIGTKSNYYNINGDDNINIGNYSNFNNTGNDNLSLGNYSNYNNNSDNNLVFGNYAGYTMTDSINNIILGNNNTRNTSKNNNNVLIGNNAFMNSQSCNHNIVLGSSVGVNASYSYRNIFLGYQTAYNSLSNRDSILIGFKSGYDVNSINSSKNNILIGNYTGSKITSASENISIGIKSGFNTTTGNENLILGNHSGYNTNSGNKNLFLGNSSGFSNTSGSRNIFLGESTGFNNITGDDNVFIGNGLQTIESNSFDNNIIRIRKPYQTEISFNCLFLESAINLNLNTSYIEISVGTNNILSNIYQLLDNPGFAPENNTTDKFTEISVTGNDYITTYYRTKLTIPEAMETFINNSPEGTVLFGNIRSSSNLPASFDINYINLSIFNKLNNSNVVDNYNNLDVSIDQNILTLVGKTNLNEYIDFDDKINIVGDLNFNGTSNINTLTNITAQFIPESNSEGNKIIIESSVPAIQTQFNSLQNIYFSSSGIRNVNSLQKWLYTQLNIKILNSINVNSTEITINNNIDETKLKNLNMNSSAIGIININNEQIQYTTKTQIGTTGTYILSGLTRGYNNTNSQNHDINSLISPDSFTNTNNCFKIFSVKDITRTSSSIQIEVNEPILSNLTYQVNIKILEPFSINVDDINLSNITSNILSNNQLLTFNNQPYKNNKVILIKSLNLKQKSISGVGYHNQLGNNNIYLGNLSSFSNIKGNDNISIGKEASYNNLTNNIISIGTQSGYNNTTGSDNIFLGYKSGYNNITGNNSIFIGSESGKGSEQGNSSNNIYIGTKTGYNNKTGKDNIFLGTFSGFENITGSNNTFIGNGLQIKYTTLSIPDVNYFPAKYSGINSLNNINIVPTIILDKLSDDKLFKLEAKILSEDSTDYTYGYIVSNNTYKFKWPLYNIDGSEFDSNEYPDNTLVYLKYTDNSEITGSDQGYIPRYWTSDPTTTQQLGQNTLFKIVSWHNSSSGYFQLMDITGNIINFSIEPNFFQTLVTAPDFNNFFYIIKYQFQVDDLITTKNQTDINKNIYKISSLTYDNLRVETYDTINNILDDSYLNNNLASLNIISSNDKIINLSKNQIRINQQEDNSRNIKYNNILNFTIIIQNNSKLQFDLQSNLIRGFEIPIRIGNQVMIQNNDIVNINLTKNTIYYISNVNYYYKVGNTINQVKSIVINTNSFNAQNYILYPTDIINTNKFSHNQKVYILPQNENPSIIYQQDYIRYLSEYQYYYVIQNDINDAGFRLAHTPCDLSNINDHVTFNFNNIPTNSRFVILESSSINLFEINISNSLPDISSTFVELTLLENSSTNKLITQDFSYISKNMSLNNNVSNSNGIIDIYQNDLVDTENISKLPYLSNNGGEWWGQYNNTINNNLFYDQNIKNEFNKYDYNDILVISKSDDNIYTELNNFINSYNSIQIKYIVSIFDGNNNFKEERIYFDSLNSNIYNYDNSNIFNEYLNTLGISGYPLLDYSIIKNTGYSNTTGNFNTFIGDSVGYSNKFGSQNTLLGYNSGHNLLSGDKNILIGSNTGYNLKKTTQNIFIGDNCGYNNLDNNNIFIGNNSAQNSQIGNSNIYLGNNSGKNSIRTNLNILIGDTTGKQIGNKLRRKADSNLIVGNFSGINQNKGSKNILLGNSNNINDDINNKFLINNQQNIIIDDDFTPYNNSKYLVINNINNVENDSHLEILDDYKREIIKVNNFNSTNNPNQILKIQKKHVKFEAQILVNQVRFYPRLTLLETSNTNFIDICNIKPDSFVYINNESHRGFMILDSITNNQIIFFNGQNDLICHYLLNDNNFSVNENQSSFSEIIGSFGDNLTIDESKFNPQSRINQSEDEIDTTFNNSIKFNTDLQYPRDSELTSFVSIFNCNNIINNKKFTSTVFFKFIENTNNDPIELITLEKTEGTTTLDPRSTYLKVSLESESINSPYKIHLKLSHESLEIDLESDYQLVNNNWYHLSIIHESNAPLQNFTQNNSISILINSKPINWIYNNNHLGNLLTFTSRSSEGTSVYDKIGYIHHQFLNSTYNFFKLRNGVFYKDFRIYDTILTQNKVNLIYESFTDKNIRVPYSEYNITNTQKNFNTLIFDISNTQELIINNNIIGIERNSLKNTYQNNIDLLTNYNFSNFNNVGVDKYFNTDSIYIDGLDNYDLFSSIASGIEENIDSKWYIRNDITYSNIPYYHNFDRKEMFNVVIGTSNLQATYNIKNTFNTGDYIDTNDNLLFIDNYKDSSSKSNPLYYKIKDNLSNYKLDNNLFTESSFTPTIKNINKLNVIYIKPPIKTENRYISNYTVDTLNTSNLEFTHTNQKIPLYDHILESYDRTITNNYYNVVSEVNNLKVSDAYQQFNSILDTDFNTNDISKLDINRNIAPTYENIDLSYAKWRISVWFNYKKYNDSISDSEYILFDNYFNKKYITESRKDQNIYESLRFNNWNNSNRTLEYDNGLIESVNYYKPVSQLIVDSHSYNNTNTSYSFNTSEPKDINSYLSFSIDKNSNYHPDVKISDRGDSFTATLPITQDVTINSSSIDINIDSVFETQSGIYYYNPSTDNGIPSEDYTATTDISSDVSFYDDEAKDISLPTQTWSSTALENTNLQNYIINNTINTDSGIKVYLTEPIHQEIIINIRETNNISWTEITDSDEIFDKMYGNFSSSNEIGLNLDGLSQTTPQFYRIESSINNNNLYCIRKAIPFKDEIIHNAQIKLVVQRIPYYYTLLYNSDYKLKISDYQYGVYNLNIQNVLNNQVILNVSTNTTYDNSDHVTPTNINQDTYLNSGGTPFDFVSVFDHLNNSIKLISRTLTSIPLKGDVLKLTYRIPINNDSDNYLLDDSSSEIIYLVVEEASINSIKFTQLVSNEDPLILPTPMESYHYLKTSNIDASIPADERTLLNNLKHIDHYGDGTTDVSSDSINSYFNAGDITTIDSNNVKSFESSQSDIYTNSGGFLINVEANFKTSQTQDDLASDAFTDSNNNNWNYNIDDRTHLKTLLNKNDINEFDDNISKTEIIHPSPYKNNHTINNIGAYKLIVFYRYDRYRNPDAELFGKFHSNIFYRSENYYSNANDNNWNINTSNIIERDRKGHGQFIPWDFSSYSKVDSNQNNVLNNITNNINVTNIGLVNRLIQQDIIQLPMETNNDYNIGQYYISNTKCFGLQPHLDQDSIMKQNLKFGLIIPIISNESEGREITIIKLGNRINKNRTPPNSLNTLGDDRNTWNTITWSKLSYIADKSNNVSFNRIDINSAQISITGFPNGESDASLYVNITDLIEVVNSEYNDGRYVVSNTELSSGTLTISISEPNTYNWKVSETENGYNVKTGSTNGDYPNGLEIDDVTNYDIHTSFGSHLNNYYNTKKYYSWAVLSHSQMYRVGNYLTNSNVKTLDITTLTNNLDTNALIETGNSEYLRYSLKVNNDTVDFKYIKNVNSIPTNKGISVSGLDINHNEWNNIIITQTGTTNKTINMYLNGIEIGTPTTFQIGSSTGLVDSLEYPDRNNAYGQNKKQPNILSLGRMYSTINESNYSNILSCPDINLTTHKFNGYLYGFEIDSNVPDNVSNLILSNYQYNLVNLNNKPSELISNGIRNSIYLNKSYLNIGKTLNPDYDIMSNNLKNIYENDNNFNKILGKITNNTSFTITMWIKLSSAVTPDYMGLYNVIGIDNTHVGTQRNYRNSYEGFNLFLEKNQTDNKYRLNIKDNRSTSSSFESPIDININEWTFIGFTYSITSNQKNLNLLVNNNYTSFSNPEFVIDNTIRPTYKYLAMIGRYHFLDPEASSLFVDYYYYGYLEDFKFYNRDLSYLELQEEYNFRISFNNNAILQCLKTCYLDSNISSTDNEIFVSDNFNLGSNDVILINMEQIKILNIHNNNLIVKRGHNNTYPIDHLEGSIIILLDKPLEYSDICHKKHFINDTNEISNNLSNNEIKENIEEQSETLLVNGSLGVKGEIIVTPSIPRQPPEGKAILWISDGNDDSIGTINNYQTDNNGKLDQGLYIAYKPKNSETIINQIMKFSSDDTVWSNNIYKKRNIDKNNVIKCTFIENSLGIGTIVLTNSGQIIPSTDETLVYNNLNLWNSGIGKIVDISNSSKKIFKLDTNISNSNYSSTWQITNKFCLSGNNILNTDGSINYSLTNKISNSAFSNKSYTLLGNNNEFSLCCPNTGVELNKYENSYCISPLFVDNTPVNLTSNSSNLTILDFNDTWFKSSRIITFESFNNTHGYYPSTWYTEDTDGELINQELVKYRFITKDDFNGSNDISANNLYDKLNSKNWITLRGKIISDNSKDIKYSNIENDIQNRSFEIDSDSFNEYSGADGTDSDIGSGWISYEGIIPKCIGFQLLFGVNSMNEFQSGPSDNHVTGWYIRNLNIYKKK